MHSSPDLPELIRRLLSTSHTPIVRSSRGTGLSPGLVVAALAVLVSFLDRCCNFRVSGVAAHIFAPCGESVCCVGHIGDECTGGPRKRAVVCNEEIMAVTVTTDAFVAILISGNLNVI